MPIMKVTVRQYDLLLKNFRLILLKEKKVIKSACFECAMLISLACFLCFVLFSFLSFLIGTALFGAFPCSVFRSEAYSFTFSNEFSERKLCKRIASCFVGPRPLV